MKRLCSLVKEITFGCELCVFPSVRLSSWNMLSSARVNEGAGNNRPNASHIAVAVAGK